MKRVGAHILVAVLATAGAVRQLTADDMTGVGAAVSTIDVNELSGVMNLAGGSEERKWKAERLGRQSPGLGEPSDTHDHAQQIPFVDANQKPEGSPPAQTLGILASQTTYALDDGKGLLTMEAVMSVISNGSLASSVMCGNGVRQGQEECDDGNLVDGDGCTKYCTVEGGYACALKMVDDMGDRCSLCKDDECTVFYFGQSRCMSTTKSNTSIVSGKTAPLHVRRITGFCGCKENHCMDIDGPLCRPEADGWVGNVRTGACECGLGYCLMEFAQQTISSPSKYHCQKLKDNMVKNETTGMCECAKGSPAVESSDPAEARRKVLPGCKVYPSTPVRKIPHQGPLYPEFTCMSTPYVKANDSDVCTNCTNSSCKMPRIGISLSKRNLGAVQPNQFYCVDSHIMETSRMTRYTDGSCRCDESECLVPYRDTMKCVPLKGSHPYGSVKLLDGKCGCSEDVNACIMPTSPGGFAKASEGFVCLRLKEGAEFTAYGKKYYRGKSGYCRCKTDRCRADPTPSSVGTFRCIDVATTGAYKLNEKALAMIKAGTSSEEDVPCTCAKGACMLPGDSRNTPRCVTCPSTPGDCIARCSPANMNTISCIKYCSMKYVKTEPRFGVGYGDLFEKKNFVARVIRCFISKTMTCEKEDGGRVCTQKITARAIYDCPGVWSKRTSRKLIDGSDTHGFKSVCRSTNFMCQKEKCNPVANPAVCLEHMILA